MMLMKDVHRILNTRFPIIGRFRKYSKKDVLPDIVAGITVGLMLIPQSIAYASLAGLDPQYGLYSSLSGGLAYAVFGTVRQITIGPSAILSLMTFYYAAEDPAAVAILTFFSGIIQTLFGVFRLGFIIDFISMPVISGYTSAAALIVATSQVKGLLGLKFEAESFVDTVAKVIVHVREAKLYDSVLGVSCLVFLIGIKILKEHYFKRSKVFFYISTAKNAIVVLCSTICAYVFFQQGKRPFSLTGDIRAGLPEFKFPGFSYVNDEGEDVSFINVLEDLGVGLISLTVVAISSHIVVAKIFTRGTRLKASQEIIAMGVSNLLGSFVGSMPVCASFSRSAVNNTSNVRTAFGGLYTVLLVIMALLVLTPYFYFIPTASLSAVVISAVIFMIETDIIFSTWKSTRRDLIPILATFIVSLFFGIEKGLFCGIGIDFAIILYYTSRPHISFDSTEVDQQAYWIITPIKGLLFPSSAYLQKKVIYQAQNYNMPELTIVVFNLTHVAQTDYSTGQVLKEVITDLKRTFKDCIIINANKTVLKQLQMLLPNLTCVSSLEPAPKRISVISLEPMRKRLSVISLESIQHKKNDLPGEPQDMS
ncbi:sodium-independent sulfate anion transporter [Halyomorpha halys]|uniref:sodium-independent sulfate anion transporter n=1 Tax=Halyomorpha halys TaxID=286706 RepID=UPI000D0C8847|nr:sodium-independent sulfate anion transporter-like [Halyomorpha halys]